MFELWRPTWLQVLKTSLVICTQSMPPDELGGAQSWHPLCAFVMGAGDAIAKRMVVRVIDLVHHSRYKIKASLNASLCTIRLCEAASTYHPCSDPMVFFRAESALAAVTDCCNMPGMEAPLQELLPSVLNMAAHRLLDEHVFSSLLHDVSSAVGLAPSSRHPKEPDSVSEAAAFPDDDREVADERASTEDGGEGAESANSGEGSDSDASWYDDEPGTSSGFMAHVLRYRSPLAVGRPLNPASDGSEVSGITCGVTCLPVTCRVISHRLPAAGYGYTFYPGFPPGTVIFCLERALSLKLGEELDHPRLPDLIGKLFRCMRWVPYALPPG